MEDNELVYEETPKEKRLRARERLLQKYRRVIRCSWGFYDFYAHSPDELKSWDEYARKNYNHFAKCSCWMCGNPRKYYQEMTIQERKSEQSAIVQFDEVGLRYRGTRKQKM